MIVAEGVDVLLGSIKRPLLPQPDCERLTSARKIIIKAKSQLAQQIFLNIITVPLIGGKYTDSCHKNAGVIA